VTAVLMNKGIFIIVKGINPALGRSMPLNSHDYGHATQFVAKPIS
jgi:hypothetical protein